uniref:Elongation factor 1-beta n=1 Tax=Fervidicoccus fontis TaxID=683846 RepID=A0A7J3ZJK3_9CREN
MARVLVVLKIYPEDVERSTREEIVDELRKRIPGDYHIVRIAEEPVAFGYSVLKVYVSIPEETEGGTERLEEIVSRLPGVEEHEVEFVHRLSEF